MRQRHATPGLITACSTLLALAGCGGGGGGSAHGGSGGAGLTGVGGAGLTGVGGLGLVDGGFGLTDGGGSTGTDGPPLQPAPPICGNGIVETGETCDVAAGCPPGQLCNATCGACAAGPAASMDSGDLIAAALAAGRIDYFTSLLYRAYRLAGDGRLPTEFDGDLTVGEDASLFLEISRQWATLTPAQQQQLAPYTARPTDPTSVYSTAPTAAFDDPGDTGDQLFAGGSDPIQCPVIAGTPTPDWRYTPANHFVIWSCGSGDLSTDPYAGKRAAAAAIADQVWDLETPSMGKPRPDDFPYGPDDKTRIDVYLVPLNKCIRRGMDNVCAALTSVTMIAGTVPDSPCDNSRGPLTSSGFILLRLDLAPDVVPAAGTVSRARSDFAHEFFHLLTHGLNLEVQGGACTNSKYTGPVGKGTWLTEASGTWAEWAYTPSDDPDYRGGLFTDYQGRVPASSSLLDNHLGATDNPAYEAFVYPLFLSQEAGNRATFEAFWKGAGGARSADALNDLLDARLPFDAHFRDFAARMLNLTLAGDPVAPLLATFDEAVPAEVPPLNPAPDQKLLPLEADFPFHVTLAPLAAQYQHFDVPDTTRWIDIDLTGAGADLTLDVVANVNGKWERRRPSGQRLTFCRDDANDDVSEMYVIIANTGHAPSAKVDQDYKLKARTACPDTFTGWFRSERLVTSNYALDADTVDDYERLSETWTLGASSTFATAGVMLPAVDVYWSGKYERHDSDVTAVTGTCQGEPVLQTEDGSGSGSHASQLVITEAGTGSIYLSATGAALGMFNAPLTSYYQTCDGMSGSSTGDNEVTEDLAIASMYVMLTADPNDPDHYKGSTVVAHSETPRDGGGSDLVDWVVTWDITRNRK